MSDFYSNRVFGTSVVFNHRDARTSAPRKSRVTGVGAMTLWVATAALTASTWAVPIIAADASEQLMSPDVVVRAQEQEAPSVVPNLDLFTRRLQELAESEGTDLEQVLREAGGWFQADHLELTTGVTLSENDVNLLLDDDEAALPK